MRGVMCFIRRTAQNLLHDDDRQLRLIALGVVESRFRCGMKLRSDVSIAPRMIVGHRELRIRHVAYYAECY